MIARLIKILSAVSILSFSPIQAFASSSTGVSHCGPVHNPSRSLITRNIESTTLMQTSDGFIVKMAVNEDNKVENLLFVLNQNWVVQEAGISSDGIQINNDGMFNLVAYNGEPLVFANGQFEFTIMLSTRSICHFSGKYNLQKLTVDPPAPIEIPVSSLPPQCALTIQALQPGIDYPNYEGSLQELKIYQDYRKDITVSFSSEYIDSSWLVKESSTSKRIGNVCPEVKVVHYGGSTGASSRWYIRRNNFSITHSRDSGYPGDYCK